MSIYTVNGSPVMHDGQFLTTGGSHDLPEYDTGDANKVLKVSPDGHSIDWYDDANTTYTAGNGLTLTGTEFSADTTVLATQTDLSGKQDKLTAGQNITIDADNVISATGGGSTYTAGTGIDITGDVISADTTVLATQADLSGKQDTLTAGTNIQINGTTISATDTTYSAGTGIDITGTTISADTSVLATQTDLSGKQDALTAGTNVQINNNVISATDTTYTAGSGLTLTGTEFSADTTVLATQQDLSGKQDTLTAGSNISIQNNVISATAAPQVQSDWTESDTNDVSYIQHKPTEKTLAAGSNVTITEANDTVTISATDTTYTAGNNITISSGVISAASQVNADWAESDTTDPSYIENKPDLVDIVAGPGIVVDNPDGNTLRVSTDEDYETVLWSGTLNTLNSNIECSENLSNFSTIKIFYRLVADSVVQSVGVHEFEPSEMSSGQNVSFGGFYLISNNFYGWWIGRLVVTDGYKVKITNTKNSWGTGASPSDDTTNYSTVGFIYKIVGIHRIQGGN